MAGQDKTRGGGVFFFSVVGGGGGGGGGGGPGGAPPGGPKGAVLRRRASACVSAARAAGQTHLTWRPDQRDGRRRRRHKIYAEISRPQRTVVPEGDPDPRGDDLQQASARAGCVRAPKSSSNDNGRATH